MTGASFAEILEGLPGISALENSLLSRAVTGVTSDSREVVPGSIFVAVKGVSQDGHQFIAPAQQKGASLVIGEEEQPSGCAPPYLRVPDARRTLAQLAARFHGNPSRSMLMIGVTGTSGKTTTTYLIESILKAAGHKAGLIGTVSFRYDGKEIASTHTTPGSVELQKLLAEMRNQGCTAVVMEVSSHALKQHRTAFIAFDGAVFTNLTPEHLDFHPDMEDYFRSKAILFNELAEGAAAAGKRPVGAVNADDEYGRRLFDEVNAKSGHPMKLSSFKVGAELRYDLNGIQGKVHGIEIRSPLIGKFNVSNVLAAVTIAHGLGIDPKAIEKGIRSLAIVPGRLQTVENDRGIHVYVDYAHKPDALENVLKTLADVKGKHRLITVFGCGGDRDRKKRPVMGKYAVELSDFAWITSDNPRTENPEAIIQEILVGTIGFRNFKTEPDRGKAIHAAIGMAQPGDLVLIAGKGHEDYQIIGTRKVHFDDREVAAEALEKYLGP